MIPRPEEFILDVRRAARLEQRPAVATGSELIGAAVPSSGLRGAALWLTPKVVEKYHPGDFSSFPAELQEGLYRAVDGFRAAAAVIPADPRAANGQIAQGIEAFRQLVSAAQRLVLLEWAHAAERLTAETEQWSAQLGWRTRRADKDLAETLLGAYRLPQLQIYAEQDLYVLDPIARFVPGAIGAFDLSIQPSFFTTSLYRAFDGTWYVGLNGANGTAASGRIGWNRDSFVQGVRELRSLV